MLKSYFKIALRLLSKHKGLSAVKIFGLSLGIGSCIFIYLFVADELSVDRFHENGEALFGVIQVQLNKASGQETARQVFIPAPVGPELIRSVPDVLRQTRLVAAAGAVRHKDKLFNETVTLVDPPFLEMFTFPLLGGDPQSALAGDHDLVLTRSLALKYFGAEDPLGRTMTIAFGRSSREYVVTGVARDVPANSSLQFGILVPFGNLPAATNDPGILNDWQRWYCPLFIQLRANATPGALAPKLDGFRRQYFGAELERDRDEGRDPFRFELERFEDMYLDARFPGRAGLSTSYLLSAIALVVLLIACINFVNISIGASSSRSLEVGMRRVLGAEKRQLLGQFGAETFVVSLFATLLGLLTAEILIPAFSALSGKRLSLAALEGGSHGLAVLGIVVLTTVLAGSYPAAVLSSFRPVAVLKGKLRIGGRTTLTRALVVAQFALSVILGIAAVSLGRQLTFMTGKDPGYASAGLIVVMTQESDPAESEEVYRRFRNEALALSRVRGVTASHREFGFFLPGSTLELDGREVFFRFNRVDPAFLTTLKCRLVQGRDFSPNVASDRDALIVNERLARDLGPGFRLGDRLGNPARGFPYDRRIVGVVRDCHFRSLRSEIEPLILYVGEGPSPSRNAFSRIIVRVDSERPRDALPDLESAWRRVRPDKPFVHYVQDDGLAGLYVRERRWSAIVRYASVLSLVLACLGILGLTSITLSRRTKEIGIRKVLGAGAGRIVVLATREFVLLVSLANLIAWPIAFLVMRRVLANYPYRIGIAPDDFLFAWLVSLSVSVLTILYLSAKVALRNPVSSLRYE